jgi:mannose-6-phosphate isomerase
MRFPEYPGHFPGEPLVPGAALLAAVQDVVDRRIVAVERARFLAPVLPGEEVSIAMRVDGDRLAFSLHRDATEVARGVATLAPRAVHADPLVIHPPWAGTRLAAQYGKGPPGTPIGETWETWPDCRVTAPGSVEGARLADVVTLPILVKLLDSGERLSVQVHPGDALAQAWGYPHGKSEGWVILHADPGARVALGLRHELSADALARHARGGTLDDHLAWHEVARGDVVEVPAGTIHAIGPGITLYEVQQPIDLTLRLYDWGRGRQLDVQRAVAAATRTPGAVIHRGRALGELPSLLVATPHFRVDQVRLPAEVRGPCALTVVEGRAEVAGLALVPGGTVVLADGIVDCRGGGMALVARAGAS